MVTSAIHIRQLTKTFGSVRALDELDLEVEQGEVHGFLGPNGAGKSTTIRILLGVLRYDSGTVTMLGADPWKEAVSLHRRVAYVPGDVELWPNLSGGETIDLFARLRGGVDRTKRDRLIERFDLDPKKQGRTYSKGNRQKVALISALASDVDILLLDEPTSGLDPLMEAEFQKCIHEEKAAGCTILLSSHILAEVEALADRISIIRQGKSVETGTLRQMQHLARTAVTAETSTPLPSLASHPGVHNLHEDGTQLQFDADNHELSGIMGELSTHGIESLKVAPPTLEQLLLSHYGPDPRRAQGGHAS